MTKIIALLSKYKYILIIGLLIIWTFISFGIISNKNKEIKSLNYQVSNLDDKVDDLEKKIKDLEDEKSDLESKVSDYENQESNTTNQFRNNLSLNGNNSSTGNANVVFRKSGCDYMILENSSGYIIAEWMGGNDPDNGDNISGDLNSFGTKDFYNNSRSSNTKLWIDDYMLSKESALEKINEKCN